MCSQSNEQSLSPAAPLAAYAAAPRLPPHPADAAAAEPPHKPPRSQNPRAGSPNRGDRKHRRQCSSGAPKQLYPYAIQIRRIKMHEGMNTPTSEAIVGAPPRNHMGISQRHSATNIEETRDTEGSHVTCAAETDRAALRQAFNPRIGHASRSQCPLGRARRRDINAPAQESSTAAAIQEPPPPTAAARAPRKSKL